MNDVKISAIIFDVGGVLIRTEDPAPRRALETRLGLRPGQAEYLVFNSDMGKAAQLGHVTTAELWAWMQNHLGLDTSGVKQFRAEFFGGDRLNTSLLTLAKKLHTRYQMAIISNFGDNLRRVITKDYPLIDMFDLVVGSAEEGIMKPNAEIFERTLVRLGRRPAEAIFIDDFAHNVEGARAVGLKTIHYTPQTNIRAELAGYGVEVD